MAVMTVRGQKDPKELGITLPHEHVYIDIRNQFTEFPNISRRVISEQKVGIANLDTLSRNPYAVKDNLALDDEKTAEEELLEYKKAGGNTIVDATLRDIGRDVILLERISRSLDINIIAGCGYYTNDTHPADMDKKTVESIAQEMISELTVGIDDTRIKAGVIGEIGTSEIIYPNEKKVLIASAMAQVHTGVGILVHTYPWGKNGIEAINILTKSGVSPNKICICHVDVEFDLDYIKGILELGAYVEFDDFGKEYFIDKRNRGFAGGVFARDIERIHVIKRLIDSGYVRSILVSCDVCLKTLLHKYGGWGYDHIIRNIIPMMEEHGISNKEIDTILIENPRTFLNSCKNN